MCALTDKAQSLGDDTHAAVARPKWTAEHGPRFVCGPLCWWVASLGHRQVLKARTRAEVNVCVMTTRTVRFDSKLLNTTLCNEQEIK